MRQNPRKAPTNFSPTCGLGEISEERKSEGVSHGVDENVGDEKRQRFPGEKDGAETLAEKRKGRKRRRLDPNALAEEDELGGTRQMDLGCKCKCKRLSLVTVKLYSRGIID